MGEWISTGDAASMLETTVKAVQRSLADEQVRREEWGDEFEGWRYKPLSGRKIYQLRRTYVERKAGGGRTPAGG